MNTIQLLMLALSLLSLPILAEEKKSNSLAESKETLSDKGKSIFADQIEGVSSKDSSKLGISNSMVKNEVIRALAKDMNIRISKNSMVYMKPRGKLKKQYIVQIFTPKSECSDTLNMASADLLAIIRYDSAQQKIKIESVLERPFDNAELLTTKLSDEYDEAMYLLGACDKIVGYDFANYCIGKSDTAFGIRTGHDEGYAGGVAYSEMVHLFLVQKGNLERVASILVYNMSELAGEWNDDGTRGHSTNEQKWVVIIDPKYSQGFKTITVKDVGNKTNRITLEWDPESGSYQKKAGE